MSSRVLFLVFLLSAVFVSALDPVKVYSGKPAAELFQVDYLTDNFYVEDKDSTTKVGVRLDSVNPVASFEVKPPSAGGRVVVKAIGFYEGKPSKKEPWSITAADEEFGGPPCLKVSSNKNRFEIELNPLCQACGGNYFFDYTVLPTLGLKQKTVSQRIHIPCQADMLMVTQTGGGKKLETNKAYYEALNKYIRAIAEEGIDAKYFELDDEAVIDSFGLEEGVKSTAAVSPLSEKKTVDVWRNMFEQLENYVTLELWVNVYVKDLLQIGLPEVPESSTKGKVSSETQVRVC